MISGVMVDFVQFECGSNGETEVPWHALGHWISSNVQTHT